MCVKGGRKEEDFSWQKGKEKEKGGEKESKRDTYFPISLATRENQGGASEGSPPGLKCG